MTDSRSDLVQRVEKYIKGAARKNRISGNFTQSDGTTISRITNDQVIRIVAEYVANKLNKESGTTKSTI